MPRPSWKGFVRISLVSVPVEGYTASAARDSQVALNQLHADCGERIRYKKTCPVHGEVTNDEIVMGHEYADDQYAVIDPSEIDALRSDADRSINVERFVDPSQVDARFFSGKTYYLVPSGKPAQKPYALLHEAIRHGGVVGLAQVVISSREQLVLLRPLGRLLVASTLYYAADVKPIDEFEKMLDKEKISAQELMLAKTLITATREKSADLDKYTDLYATRLRELVDAKIEGRRVAKPKVVGKLPPTINLIEALKASLGQSKGKRSAAPRKAPTRRKRSTG